MEHFVGLDISDARTNFCIVDEKGNSLVEKEVPTDPRAILGAIRNTGLVIKKIGMETGAKSNWLYRNISPMYDTDCYDAHKMGKLLGININKTDRNDARIIAETARTNYLSRLAPMTVYVKKEASQEIITLIRSRENLVQQNINTCNRIRGILKTHGFAVPPQTEEAFIHTILDMLPTLPKLVAKAIKDLFTSYEPTLEIIRRSDRDIEALAEKKTQAKLLMTIPEIGSVTALYIATIIDDPKRFTNPKALGAYLGLTPLQYSSGEKKFQACISKRGDSLARKLLVGAGERILQKNKPSNALKRWGKKIQARKGSEGAAIALARHIGEIMWAMLTRQTPYIEPEPVKQKKPKTIITTEELESLLNLARLTGSIECCSIQQMKSMGNNSVKNK